MGDAGFFKGTNAAQDNRFSNKEKKLLKSMSFPREFNQKVDMKKVNLEVIRPWISNRITELLGFEDEVVADYASSLLEEEGVEPKMMQINLTGFLESNAKVFVKELWILLLSAQNSVGGIPAIFLEQKKEELRIKKEKEDQRRAERDSVMETIKKRRWDEKEDLRGSRESRFDQRRRSNSRERGRRSYSRSPKRNYSRSPRRQYSRSPPRRHRSPHDDRYRSSRDDRRRDDRYRRTDDYYRDRPEHRESRRRD